MDRARQFAVEQSGFRPPCRWRRMVLWKASVPANGLLSTSARHGGQAKLAPREAIARFDVLRSQARFVFGFLIVWATTIESLT